MTLVYKICPAPLWREAEAAGRFRGAPVDLADGYIHFSTAAQARETAARHFAGESDLVLVAVDADALGAALRWEPSRGGDLFPHLYGELPVAAARSVAPLPLGPDGAHAFPSDFDREAPADPAVAGWSRTPERDGFVGLVGPVWQRDDGGGVRYAFLAESRHINRNGILHGGMVMTFADQALGLTAVASHGGRSQATIQLDTHFVSAVREGEFVEARCRVVRRTRALVFMTGELVVGERIVATASGVWKLREPDPVSGSGPVRKPDPVSGAR